jgi:pimeloyl-ACP methyl ester carboxylesterase
MANSVVLVHGWSSSGSAFSEWEKILASQGIATVDIHTCTYKSLTNEVTIKDIAEAFDRALRLEPTIGADGDFDAIVHSTGMLVIRAWLITYPSRKNRLKRLIGFAPATNGSPLAHKGRSWLGSIFKGSKDWGPDFLEAGDRILDGLELASKYTWDLAHEDLFGETLYYGDKASTPYVFIFCGTQGYGGLASLVHDEGSDGTVRIAGAGFEDLTREPEGEREQLQRPAGPDAPVYLVASRDHGTILTNPPRALIDMVARALQISSGEEWERWKTDARAKFTRPDKLDEWQQFVVRCVDERGDPITDYNVQLMHKKTSGLFRGIKEFDMHVHTYRADPSLRCFHVNLTQLNKLNLKTLELRIIASSGSSLVAYHGVSSEKVSPNLTSVNADGKWDAKIDLSSYLEQPNFTFFYPFTTTFLEIRLNREPMPLNALEKNFVCWFGEAPKP